MPDRDLTIKLKLDRGQAPAEAAAQEAAHTRVTESARRSAQAIEQAGQAQVRAFARGREELGRFSRAGEQAGQATARGLDGATGAAGRLAGELSLVTARLGGVGAALGALKAGAEIFAEIRQNSQVLAADALKARDALRDLSSLKGSASVTGKDIADVAEFRVKTGLRQEEAIQFQTQFLGSLPAGIQKGNITQEVADQLQVEAGTYAARRGGSAATRGDLAGLISQFGKIESAEQGLGQIEAIRQGLTEGRGEDTPLTQQLLKAGGSLVREGGPVPTLPELAAVIGVTSLSAGAEESGTRAEQLVRGLKGGLAKEGKGIGAEQSQAEYLRGLGVTEKDSLEQILGKVAPDIRKAQAAGRDTDVYLAEQGFRGYEERRAISEVVQNYDVFKQRLAKAKAAEGGAAEIEANRQFLSERDPLGFARQGEAIRDREKARVATEASQRFEGEKLRAEAQLIAEGQDQSFTAGARRKIESIFTGGQVSGRDIEIERRARANQLARGETPGGTALIGEYVPTASRLISTAVNPLAGLLYGKEGGAPRFGDTFGGGTSPEALDVQKQQLAEQRKTNEMLARQQNQPAKILPPLAPPRPSGQAIR